MPRRKVIQKRPIIPDAMFNSKIVAKFINNLLEKGKKSTAEAILYGSFKIIQEKLKERPILIFEKALENVKPILEVKSRRVGGSTYQVPTEIVPARRVSLGIKWIIYNALRRNEKTMKQKLAAELIDAANNRGSSVKKKEDIHKMAEANRAFAHYKF